MGEDGARIHPPTSEDFLVFIAGRNPSFEVLAEVLQVHLREGFPQGGAEHHGRRLRVVDHGGQGGLALDQLEEFGIRTDFCKFLLGAEGQKRRVIFSAALDERVGVQDPENVRDFVVLGRRIVHRSKGAGPTGGFHFAAQLGNIANRGRLTAVAGDLRNQVALPVDEVAHAKENANAGDESHEESDGLVHSFEGSPRLLIGAVLEEQFNGTMGRDSDHQEDDGQEAEDNHPGQECEVDEVLDPHHDEAGTHQSTDNTCQHQAQRSANEADAPTNSASLMAQQAKPAH